jgi:hypothetical protein
LEHWRCLSLTVTPEAVDISVRHSFEFGFVGGIEQFPSDCQDSPEVCRDWHNNRVDSAKGVYHPDLTTKDALLAPCLVFDNVKPILSALFPIE